MQCITSDTTRYSKAQCTSDVIIYELGDKWRHSSLYNIPIASKIFLFLLISIRMMSQKQISGLILDSTLRFPPSVIEIELNERDTFYNITNWTLTVASNTQLTSTSHKTRRKTKYFNTIISLYMESQKNQVYTSAVIVALSLSERFPRHRPRPVVTSTVCEWRYKCEKVMSHRHILTARSNLFYLDICSINILNYASRWAMKRSGGCDILWRVLTLWWQW